MVANNTSDLSSKCVASAGTIHVAVSYLYIFEFPIALFLNGVSAWLSLHIRSTSTLIVYVKNQVAANLLMTLMLPPMAATLLPGAAVELRAFACRYSNVVFYGSLYASISLTGLISLDRFFKIVRPFGKVLGQNVTFSLVMSTLVWAVLLGSTVIPTIILTDRSPGNYSGDFCLSLKSPAGQKLQAFVVLFMEILFWFVSVLIVFCYICITVKVVQSFRNSGSKNSRGTKKTKLRVFLVILVFFVCFMPLHILRIPFTLYEFSDDKDCADIWLVAAHNITLWMSSTNICLDPLLYSYLSKEYRDKLVSILKAGGILVGLSSGENEEVSLDKKKVRD
ncbi:P2Y purinoceptor 13-like [Pleuronectes platessa]|uniref:P2Y purinoceptor 13-like n=1 Tax=Pleuronectes platessa TaxID=8262 RepID=UPI00232A1A60|nr:P2Y purinoceptor 13-like [Pleuronectes platessa]